RSEHEPAENASLLIDQERGEREPKHNPEELGAISDEHLEGDPAHGTAPCAKASVGLAPGGSPPESSGGAKPSAANEKAVMCSATKPTSKLANSASPINRAVIGLAIR